MSTRRSDTPLRCGRAGQEVRVPARATGAVERLRGLPPVLAPHTRLVVLGSFPSVASLGARQYYAHPRNHFWPILCALWGVDLRAMPYEARLEVVRSRGLGIWDVYAQCRREGSLDSAIEDAQFNDFDRLLREAPALEALAHNGGESARAMRHTRTLGVAVYRLPSTSPANASWSFERKLEAWREVFTAHGLA
ncbi:DNA-deoxyinosine glycosylase [Caldimonas aquatica]|uniref:DNA-deoxyinosine glycosylase n=1 Tax=Caldimonas aquatica TaxID=376175 RepID=A0ABY6MQJ9_9BURK|nr:DNA-deoxyinosine glycosylase [Schlegelella aquatica]UZD54213.1 DNA-deoxyinosine glycosylase [Schlegelella aquatica]